MRTPLLRGGQHRTAREIVRDTVHLIESALLLFGTWMVIALVIEAVRALREAGR